jgi:hypothetical protein
MADFGSAGGAFYCVAAAFPFSKVASRKSVKNQKKARSRRASSHVVFVRDCGDAHVAQSFCFLNLRAAGKAALVTGRTGVFNHAS